MPGAKPGGKVTDAPSKPQITLEIEDRWRREGIENLLASSGFSVGGRRAGIVLIDAPRPWREAREALFRTRARYPDADVLVFVPDLRRVFVEPCLRAGAMGVLHFNAEPRAILSAIEAVSRGDIWAPRNLLAKAIRGFGEVPSKIVSEFNLTRAERRVLDALRENPTNKEIAGMLGSSESTIKFHIHQLFRKTGTASRRELALIAAGEGH